MIANSNFNSGLLTLINAVKLIRVFNNFSLSVSDMIVLQLILKLFSRQLAFSPFPF